MKLLPLFFILGLFIGCQESEQKTPAADSKSSNTAEIQTSSSAAIEKDVYADPDILLKNTPEFHPKSAKDFVALFKKSDTILVEQKNIRTNASERTIKLNAKQKRALAKIFSTIERGEQILFAREGPVPLSMTSGTYMVTLTFKKEKQTLTIFNYHVLARVKLANDSVWRFRNFDSDKFFSDMGFYCPHLFCTPISTATKRSESFRT